MWGTDTLEYRLSTEAKLKEIKEMLQIAIPETNKIGNAWKYASKIAKDKGYEDMPVSEIYNKEQLRALSDATKDDRTGAVFAAIVVGFINGAEWEKNKLKK